MRQWSEASRICVMGCPAATGSAACAAVPAADTAMTRAYAWQLSPAYLYPRLDVRGPKTKLSRHAQLVGGRSLRHFDVDSALAAGAEETDASCLTESEEAGSPDSLAVAVLLNHPRVWQHLFVPKRLTVCYDVYAMSVACHVSSLRRSEYTLSTQYVLCQRGSLATL